VTANKFATEAFMDEVARKHGQDPLAFRLELIKGMPRAYNAVTIMLRRRGPDRPVSSRPGASQLR
jgi:isoquinoline 1-oxidoreductase beta subunit